MTAARIENIARTALAAGHTVSAGEAFLRASNYYRTADFYRREDPASDTESARIAAASQQAFAQAADLLDIPASRVRIPYAGTTLPGYFFFADTTGEPTPDRHLPRRLRLDPRRGLPRSRGGRAASRLPRARRHCHEGALAVWHQRAFDWLETTFSQ